MKVVCTAGPETWALLAMDQNLWHPGPSETVPVSEWFMSGICQVDKDSSTFLGVISPPVFPLPLLRPTIYPEDKGPGLGASLIPLFP